MNCPANFRTHDTQCSAFTQSSPHRFQQSPRLVISKWQRSKQRLASSATHALFENLFEAVACLISSHPRQIPPKDARASCVEIEVWLVE